VGICSLEEVGSVSDRPAWFQLYMLKDRAVVKEILDNAWALGVRTLAFTIDLNVLGTRYRDIRNGMAGGLGLWGKLRSGPIDFALHPRWAFDVGLFGRPHGLGNLTAYVKGGSHTRDFQRWVGAQFDSSVTWKDIEWLRSVWKGNLLLKGILDIEDARQAVALGADGMVVSNHGGRQLDGVASTAVMLPRIADAVGSETVLLVDGGIRTGQDLVRALALGARAALIGRPWAMAMAAGGEAALSRYLDLVRTDMRVAMALSGVSTAGAIDRAIIFDA
jgi:L-lactate dehydrogenase (cytochrome)